jgi:hypothetical protein
MDGEGNRTIFNEVDFKTHVKYSAQRQAEVSKKNSTELIAGNYELLTNNTNSRKQLKEIIGTPQIVRLFSHCIHLTNIPKHFIVFTTPRSEATQSLR